MSNTFQNQGATVAQTYLTSELGKPSERSAMKHLNKLSDTLPPRTGSMSQGHKGQFKRRTLKKSLFLISNHPKTLMKTTLAQEESATQQSPPTGTHRKKAPPGAKAA